MSTRSSVRARRVRPEFLHTMWDESRRIADARHRFLHGGNPEPRRGRTVPAPR
ncbi:hypothetical protein [Saccharopolyspora gregorii]|uniref:Uncharacterized protein n=1 Tax=Saccharopolyspora gregorii TaxID=33914 RepID=A0ABP6RNG3_9PSEU|nr:hypothetical protein [Saccharopolyspora gregorii]